MPQELADRLARLAELNDEDLVALLADLKSFYDETRNSDNAREHIAALQAARDARNAIVAVQTERAEAAARDAEILAALDAEMSDPEPEPEVEEPEVPAEPEPAVEEPAPEVEPEEARVPVAAAAAPTPPQPPARPASVAQAAAHVPAAVQARPRPAREANRIVAVAAGVEGAQLDGMDDVARLARAQIHNLRGTTGVGRASVARVLADYPADRVLGRDAEANGLAIARAGAGRGSMAQEALVAAGGICVPAEPYYGMAQMSDDARPVRAGLVGFQANRGGITFVSPNDINDYTSGVDEWTVADDEAVTSSTNTWKTVLDITCGTVETVELRAVTAIATIGNWYDRTHPEAVRADLLNLTAAHSRKAEGLLLQDIKSGSTAVTAANLVGFARDFLVRAAQSADGIRSYHRISPETNLRVLAPNWVRSAMISDLTLQAPGDDAISKAIAEIDGYLNGRNLTPIWYMDTPDTGGDPSQTIGAQSAGALNGYPSYVQFGIFPEGQWLFLDGGELDLGVVRDFDLNRQNKLGIFSETFEKAANVGLDNASFWIKMLVDISGGFSCCDELGS